MNANSQLKDITESAALVTGYEDHNHGFVFLVVPEYG